jgi:hypothetical protein
MDPDTNPVVFAVRDRLLSIELQEGVNYGVHAAHRE